MRFSISLCLEKNQSWLWLFFRVLTISYFSLIVVPDSLGVGQVYTSSGSILPPTIIDDLPSFLYYKHWWIHQIFGSRKELFQNLFHIVCAMSKQSHIESTVEEDKGTWNQNIILHKAIITEKCIPYKTLIRIEEDWTICSFLRCWLKLPTWLAYVTFQCSEMLSKTGECRSKLSNSG